jgi:pimeloyl-ACP methyl ester carboxylesterase
MHELRAWWNRGRSRLDHLLNRSDDYLWAWGLRRYRLPGLKRAAATTGQRAPAPSRAVDPFDYGCASASFQHPVEIEGRLYNYVFYPGTTDALCVHFSAFFESSGERRAHRAQFHGYFHRMRMFWPLSEYNVLFLVDTFGAEKNGSYYKGENGDFFVERATDEIIQRIQAAHELSSERTVALGSSMGATGALRFGLRHGYKGVVAVCPHIDLDLSAIYQDRVPHVAAILGTDDVTDPGHVPVTREIRNLAETATRLPRLAIQSMKDDVGVHEEQVLPFVELWRGRGGAVSVDYHDVGGHTSDYATIEYFRRSIEWALDD